MGDNKTIIQIFDDGEIHRAWASLNPRDIRDPFLIRVRGRKVTLEQVGITMLVRTGCHALPDLPPARDGADAHFLHEPQNCFVIDRTSLFPPEPMGDASLPIGPMRRAVGWLDDFDPFPIRLGSIHALPPRIISGSRNPKEGTPRLNGVFLAPLIDHPIWRFASSTLRNSVWNFFKSAFSIRKRSNSDWTVCFLRGRPMGLPKVAAPSRR